MDWRRWGGRLNSIQLFSWEEEGKVSKLKRRGGGEAIPINQITSKSRHFKG
jgi:hypothetical protein